jgi:hypothetical protein
MSKITWRKFTKAIVAAGTLVTASGLATEAGAGLKENLPAWVRLAGANSAMGGSLGSVRNSSDGTQYIQCVTAQNTTGWVYGTCYAVDANGTSASCWTNNSALVQQMNAIGGDSSATVYFDADSGACTYVYVQNGSLLAPKAL